MVNATSAIDRWNSAAIVGMTKVSTKKSNASSVHPRKLAVSVWKASLGESLLSPGEIGSAEGAPMARDLYRIRAAERRCYSTPYRSAGVPAGDDAWIPFHATNSFLARAYTKRVGCDCRVLVLACLQ